MSTADWEAELAEAREAEGIPSNGEWNGRSIADRVDDPLEVEEAEEQEELFYYEEGRRVTLSQIVARGTPVEYSVNLNSKSFKGSKGMGLLPFSNPDILLLVPARQGKVVADPTYDESGLVVKVSIRANLKPQGAYDVASPEGQALLEGE